MPTYKSLVAGLYLAAASFAFGAGSAQAGLMDNGMITLDTDTGLEWLDLTESTNRSFNDVSSEFGAGGDFAGWRHATAADLTTLFTNAGFPPPHSSSPATAPFLALVNLFGATAITPGPQAGLATAAQGIFDDQATGSLPREVGFAVLAHDTIFRPADPRTFNNAGVFPDGLSDFANPTVGHWLVRPAAIPEPSLLILFGSGVVLLGAIRRRKQTA